MNALFRVGPVDHESVGFGPAAVDGLGAVRLVTGDGVGADTLRRVVAGVGRNARLQGEQIDKGAAIQRNRGDLGALDDHTHLGALRFDVQRVAANGDGVRYLANLQRNVNADGGIGIDLYPGLLVIAESGLAGGDVIGVNAKGGQIIKALGVSDCGALHIRRYGSGHDGHARYHGAARVSDYAGD